MTDKIQFTCPHCSHQMQLLSSTVGKQGKCPSCNAVVTITSSAPETPPSDPLHVANDPLFLSSSPEKSDVQQLLHQPQQQLQQPSTALWPQAGPTIEPENTSGTSVKIWLIGGAAILILVLGAGLYVKQYVGQSGGFDEGNNETIQGGDSAQTSGSAEETSPSEVVADASESNKATTDKAAADKVAADKVTTDKVDKTIVNGIGMKLKLIAAGEFQMGSPGPGQDEERPQHLVKITKPFYLGVYEVTQQQYEKVMRARPWQDGVYVKEGADYPASDVSHNDAVEFCDRLSKQEGVEYRLPTEAEWEYACRAGTTTVCSFGDDVFTTTGAMHPIWMSKLGQYSWNHKNAMDIGEEYAHRVGQKLPNPWGLYDMHGNVYEWCQDWKAFYESKKVVSDPIAPDGSDPAGNRVLRGGSFMNGWGSAYRVFLQPDNKQPDIGFRVVRIYRVSP